MGQYKPKPQNQVRNDWVRRRQNIARGMKIALYEINQALASQGLQVVTGPDFIPYTIAVAEGGRATACPADVQIAGIWNMHRQLQERGYTVVRL